MEIRDPIHGTIHLSDAEVNIIDTPEFQRLRSIKQLGFSEFSYPGATHNRYLHSIGVTHLAGMVFDQVFKNHAFSSESVKKRMRQVLRLGALLHDVGHGPLSHTTEEVMPQMSKLEIEAYKYRISNTQAAITENKNRKATHEDFTLKYITDSPLTEILKENFSDIHPLHISSLVDHQISYQDEFFIDNGFNYKPILGQLVSGELDCDRMDYLERDSFFCGTNYGKIDLPWLTSNLLPYLKEDKFYLGLSRRALYTFDDFLLSRHHMHLMVYFHHKSIVYEEMLHRYLTSNECEFFLPSNIAAYTKCNDYKLYEHLSEQKNTWAQRIAERRPYRVLTELHTQSESQRPEIMKKALEDRGIDVIMASSSTRLSKYHALVGDQRAYPIYVVDTYDKLDKPAPVDQSTEIFTRYEGNRIIYRLYVAPENHRTAGQLLAELRL